MQYKTIMLELVQQFPALHYELRANKRLLPAIERYASALKDRHTYWISRLSQEQPQSAPQHVTSAALEIAVQEIREALPEESPQSAGTQEAFSLDATMTYLSRHTPPA